MTRARPDRGAMNQSAFEPPAIAGGIPDLPYLPFRIHGPGAALVLVGRHALARGVAEHGIRDLSLYEQPVLTCFELEGARAHQTIETPVYLQRELGTGITERVFLPLDHAAAAWSWFAHRATQTLLRFRFSAGSRDLVIGGRWAAIPNVACWFDRDVKVRLVAATMHADIELHSGETLTMVAAAREPSGAAVSAMAQLPALARSRLAGWRRAASELVTIDCSDSHYADQVNWSAYQLYAAGALHGQLTPSDLEPAPIHLRSVAAPLLHFLRATLGLEVDPPSQRIELRPRLPAEWSRLEARNLPCGDATVSLHYERTGTRHMFQLTPVAGAVPARVAFLPLIGTRRIASVAVDGQPAVLDYRETPDGVVCPVQLVLDHTRTIHIEAGA